MTLVDLLAQHWFALIQTCVLIAATLFTGIALVIDIRMRKAANLIRLTDRHRELWESIYERPELVRVLNPDPDLVLAPMTAAEERFMIFVILHLNDTFYLIRAGFLAQPEGLRKDIQRFFSLPIPRETWRKVRDLQETAFVTFVENCCPELDSDRDEAGM